MGKLWFTGDTHFGHARIIAHCERPFADATEMDRALVENWNARVQPDDEVIHLGDMMWKTSEDAARRLRARLNGRILLVPGNHDRVEWLVAAGVVDEVLPQIHEMTIQDASDKRHVVLCHYPLAEWNRFFRGAIHLHGHCHGRLPTPHGMYRLDAGVDVHGFAPISAKEVLRRFPQERK